MIDINSPTLRLCYLQGAVSGSSGAAKMPIVKYGEKTVLVDTATVSFTKDGDNDWYISGDDPLGSFSESDMQTNTLYTITWDGVEYKVFYQARMYWAGGANNTAHSCKFVGNPTEIGFDAGYPTDAPFCIVQSWPDEHQAVTIYAFGSTAATHVIKIEKTPYTVEIVPKLYYEEASTEGVIPVWRGSGDGSAVINQGRQASGIYSLAIGQATIASGHSSFAGGTGTIASGKTSFAFGTDNEASGNNSFATGIHTVASGNFAYTQGNGSVASNSYAHAEGGQTVASGNSSHAEGVQTIASGSRAHAEGSNTIANHRDQHALGAFNVADTSAEASTAHGTYIEIVGNGTADNARSNARTLDWNGNEWLAGSLTLGNTTLTEAQLIQLLTLLS